jgi:hypothetical protein
MTFINNLGDAGQGDVAVAGGKGVGLGLFTGSTYIQKAAPIPYYASEKSS